MKAPSLLLTLSALHAAIWSAGVFAVFSFMSMGGAFGAVVVWAASIGAFGATFAVHMLVASIIRNRMKARG